MAENVDNPKHATEDSVLSTPVSELSVGARVRNVLADLECETIADVLKFTEAELFRQPNFGRVSMKELKEALYSKGVERPPEFEPYRAPSIESLKAREGKLLDRRRYHRRHLGRIRTELKKVEVALSQQVELNKGPKLAASMPIRPRAVKPHKAGGSEPEPWRWQAADGRWWTCGDVTPNGNIVGLCRFISRGVVWISADNLELAQAAGWKPNGCTTDEGGLVQVEREVELA